MWPSIPPTPPSRCAVRWKEPSAQRLPDAAWRSKRVLPGTGPLAPLQGEEERAEAVLVLGILVIAHEDRGLTGHPDQEPQGLIHHWRRTGDEADRAVVAAGHLAAHHVGHHAACQANGWELRMHVTGCRLVRQRQRDVQPAARGGDVAGKLSKIEAVG